jgi:hypothetical protein
MTDPRSEQVAAATPWLSVLKRCKLGFAEAPFRAAVFLLLG